MTLVCQQCDKGFEPPAKGPRPKFCGDACRQAAHRGVLGRSAAKPRSDAQVPAPVTSRASTADLGDGDPCPQDPGHGRMYFIDQPKTRQWCGHSAHRGNDLYARDGVTSIEHGMVGA